MREEPSIAVNVEEHPDSADEAIVREAISAYNQLQTGISDSYRPLDVFIRDDKRTIIAGLLGGTYWGWLYVGSLWVSDEYRHKGYGRQLLRAAEAEALRRGCQNVHLDTMSFQALPFYIKQGYTIWGELHDLPPGYTRHSLLKRLQP